jgi:hypothetical protein
MMFFMTILLNASSFFNKIFQILNFNQIVFRKPEKPVEASFPGFRENCLFCHPW